MPSSRIPKGATVLVTGANGFIAAHMVKIFLSQGYKVRGTVRSTTKSKWLIEDVFHKEASDGAFELVAVEDVTQEDAFKDAVKGVSSIVHVATVFNNFDPNPNNVVAPTVAAVINLLKTADREPSVKSFVYTSSIVAAGMLQPDVPFTVDKDSWNDASVSMAWAPPPYEQERAMTTYSASKVEAEKAFWKFVKEEKPSFVANSVLPFTVFGPLLSSKQSGTTNSWVYALFNGDPTFANMLNASQSLPLHDFLIK